MSDLLKKLFPCQSEFSHYYASWAANHMGWAKMKKTNRKLVKAKLKREVEKQIKEDLTSLEGDM